ncbi:MAG: extracellular solute-binding protein [Clostridiales bacterium]|nr:extracellular solute-binding protein [Clostridiales bacterium]
MSRKWRNILIGVVAVAAVIVLMVLLNQGPSDYSSKYAGTDLSTEVSGIGRGNTYDAYVASHASAPEAKEEVSVDVLSFEGEAAPQTEGLFTDDGSVVTWHVDVPQAGLYNIRLEYLTTQSRGVDIERELLINGELPFTGASTLCFSRLWTDEGEVRKDNQGNDIRPTQKEILEKQTAFCHDDMGYQTEPYAFWFEQGDNTLTLKAVNEPVVICGITLTPIAKYPEYTEYAASLPEVTMSEEAKNYSQTVQGESAQLRSAPSLYARYDRSSSQTVPYSVTNTILNFIGGDPWTHPGEWIQWNFSVPEDGYYNISVKARQMYQRGALSGRTVYIDGEIPFKEMEAVTFSYNTSWQMRTLSDENGNPYRFYLTQGDHTFRMEVTLGEMGPVLKDVEDSIFRLNQIYRKLLVLTGVNPDRFRDYNLAKVYPEAIEAMDLESRRLYKIVDDIVAITGEKSDRAAVAQTLAYQLETFVQSNDRITESFTNFKDNITSLGTAMQNMSESKLDVDLIMVTGENVKVPAVHESFFQSMFHEIRSCISSFFVDYNSLGDKYDDTDDVLEIWITTGRDQSTVLKTMVDDTFTAKTNIKVNVKLVQADAILTAVVAGNGPDIVLSVSGWFAVNYAMRNAVEDLTQFPDYAEVVKPFYQSILDPLTYNNGTKVGVYGLPETQNYNLLFYRTDIMEELGLEIPKTWDDLIAELPTIQGNSLTVGVPFPDIAIADISVLGSMIYQNGGAIYDADAKHTVIDSEAGVAAFKQYTSLYNDYGLPVVYDFVSRFRSGEMPLGVASYATYNTLMVSAPEIRGLWDFTYFPGTLQEDGSIDNTVQTDGLCCLMIATDNEQTKQNAWEFMKWWVSADAQVRFGREMESVLGASARYQTANRDALRQLAWSSKQLKILETQMANTRGFPEIAGGYSTTRHITNAIRRVINTKEDPRETLLNYARTINEEIRIKRREFNLPLD